MQAMGIPMPSCARANPTESSTSLGPTGSWCAHPLPVMPRQGAEFCLVYFFAGKKKKIIILGRKYGCDSYYDEDDGIIMRLIENNAIVMDV